MTKENQIIVHKRIKPDNMLHVPTKGPQTYCTLVLSYSPTSQQALKFQNIKSQRNGEKASQAGFERIQIQLAGTRTELFVSGQIEKPSSYITSSYLCYSVVITGTSTLEGRSFLLPFAIYMEILRNRIYSICSSCKTYLHKGIK